MPNITTACPTTSGVWLEPLIHTDVCVCLRLGLDKLWKESTVGEKTVLRSNKSNQDSYTSGLMT